MVESGSWLYDGNYVPFDQVIKKMVTGLLDLNTYNLVQVTNISIAQYVKSQTKNKNQKRNIGVKSIGNDMIDLHHVIKGSHRDCPLFMLKNNYGIIYLYL